MDHVADDGPPPPEWIRGWIAEHLNEQVVCQTTSLFKGRFSFHTQLVGFIQDRSNPPLLRERRDRHVHFQEALFGHGRLIHPLLAHVLKDTSIELQVQPSIQVATNCFIGRGTQSEEMVAEGHWLGVSSKECALPDQFRAIRTIEEQVPWPQQK